jgi:hypothetical protein
MSSPWVALDAPQLVLGLGLRRQILKLDRFPIQFLCELQQCL